MLLSVEVFAYKGSCNRLNAEEYQVYGNNISERVQGYK